MLKQTSQNSTDDRTAALPRNKTNSIDPGAERKSILIVTRSRTSGAVVLLAPRSKDTVRLTGRSLYIVRDLIL